MKKFMIVILAVFLFGTSFVTLLNRLDHDDFEHVHFGNAIPIIELNGLTLKEVFETYTVDIPQTTNLGVTWSFQNNVIQANGTPTVNIYQNIAPNMTLGNKVYYNLKYISGTLTGPAFIYNNSVVQLVETNNNYSGFHVIDFSNFRFRISNGTISDNYSAYMYVTDLTDLGISHLTLEQMDYYYNLYQTNLTNPQIDEYFLDVERMSYWGRTLDNDMDGFLKVLKIVSDGSNIVIQGLKNVFDYREDGSPWWTFLSDLNMQW